MQPTRHFAWDTPGETSCPPKDTLISAFKTMKSLDEIRRIAKELNVEALATLSDLDLNVLLATLNRYRPEPMEEEFFAAFYLKVADQVRNRGT
jgi:hypothetical protein